MKLAPPPLAIGPNDGFEKTDLFGYRDFGERFVHIVEALDSATVILLDGPWGSGKTTFTQQWAGLLRHRGQAVAQFDAFANDYEDDAFIALAGAMNASSRDGKTAGAKKLKASFLKAATGVIKTLPSIATRVVVNLITQGALSSASVSKLVESIESANASQLEKRIAKAHENTQAVNDVSVEQLNYRPAKLCDIRRLARRLLEGRTVPGHSTRARLNIVETTMP